MSGFLPAPCTMVVFSFSMITFLARPSMAVVTFSSLIPRSSEISWPPVRTAMSSSMALRRSPKPGAFTAATFRPPRSLLTTSVAIASPSTSSAMMTRGLPDGCQDGKHRLQAGELLFVEQDVGILELGEHLLGIGDEVGRDVAAIELHSFDDLDLGFERLGFLNRDDALVADLLHRLRDHLADRRIAVRRDRADLRDFRRRANLLCALLDVLHHCGHRDVDAALEVHRIHPGGNSLGTFLDDRLCQHSRGGGAVAGEIVGLLGNLAHHLRAHVLELVRSEERRVGTSVARGRSVMG